MKTLTSDREGQLVVADSPVLIWFVAALFLCVGLLAISVPAFISPDTGFANWDIAWNVQALIVVAGVFFAFTAIRVFYRCPQSVGVFDRDTRTVTISHRRVFCPARKSVVGLQNIVSAVLLETPDPEGGVRRELLLTLRSGERVLLSEMSLSSHDEAMEVQQAIQSFLFQAPSERSSVMVH